MIDKLNFISENLNLWEKAKNYAQKCIDNYISESIFIDFPMLSKNDKTDFILTKNSQSLIFWKNGKKTNIIRTTYNLNLENKIKNITGKYSLDVDENGKFVDEYLTMN